MSNEAVTQMQKQFDSTIAGPARTYASLVLDHFEQLASLQFDAVKAYAETGVQQARAALDVKDASDVRAYVENQQKIAKDLGERFKGDAEKVVSLNQDFAQKAQKVTEDTAKSASKAAGQSK
ncbi:phasin family protein [Aquisalimonas lutea]|uniref:phasin family protein n=1 Tax=Aquisalimonas lutea TaxID=1327750 RepID=UPI0025B5B80C|nr:phasin family protein [Aquisalimonas lutea]MDN3517592.1 phasin family protein [Aquisalimonas lutea]